MRIQNIQQNNTNFQGLYGSKSALRKLNHSSFKSEVGKLAKDCDVLVRQNSDDFWTPLLATVIGSLGGSITALCSDSLPYGLLAGFVSLIVSAIPICNIFSNNTIQIGEKIKKDDESGELVRRSC